MKEKTYTNYLREYGVSDEDAKKRCEEIFATIFHGSDEERFFCEVGDDMGYMEDTGNHDARTEGMSYGMMMSVQMNRKDEFDRLWKWSKTYMYHEDGRHEGYFAWSCATDGTKNAQGAAPDGEEYYAMALIFAGNRWGCGEGIFDYHTEARRLLHYMIRKGSGDLQGCPMFDPVNHYIKFVAELDFTDPSYHLPHFYELYAEYAYDEDKEFFVEAAKASREYWKKCCHPVTGLNPEYGDYDGTPHTNPAHQFGGRHDWYYSDAYRTMINIALDTVWNGETEWAKQQAERVLDFFNPKQTDGSWQYVYNVDGTRQDQKVLHPVAAIASNASAAVLAPDKARAWVEMFLEGGLRDGDRRYYDNCLYFFVYLLLSGNYRIW